MIGWFVERFVQSSEPLLTGCVPDLQDHDFVVDGDVLFAEFEADCRVSANVELVIDIAGYDVGLAHSALPSNKSQTYPPGPS